MALKPRLASVIRKASVASCLIHVVHDGCNQVARIISPDAPPWAREQAQNWGRTANALGYFFHELGCCTIPLMTGNSAASPPTKEILQTVLLAEFPRSSS